MPFKSQDETGTTNKLSTTYYGKGQLEKVGNLVEGEEDGEWTYYHKSGNFGPKEIMKMEKL